ncbi:hypothetical protein Vadar_032289 [Vaccinium darrowii]|uniref:Uncharacterized protein n=1 Tax=Vaccinium darrowii TaxID=229202 RepID=A0ACB7Y4L7_9ERIC|nr:hypothetical protein Vadar_032289 [Vaccinium darrowii]
MRQEIGKKVIVVEGVLDELSWSSDSEIADNLDYLDFEDDDESIQGAFTLHGSLPGVPMFMGFHYHPNTSLLQSLSDRN